MDEQAEDKYTSVKKLTTTTPHSRSIDIEDVLGEHGFIRIIEAHTIAANTSIEEGGISNLLDKAPENFTTDDCIDVLEAYLKPFGNWAESLKLGKQTPKVLKTVSNIPHVSEDVRLLAETYVRGLQKATDGDISKVAEKTLKRSKVGFLDTEVSDTGEFNVGDEASNDVNNDNNDEYKLISKTINTNNMEPKLRVGGIKIAPRIGEPPVNTGIKGIKIGGRIAVEKEEKEKDNILKEPIDSSGADDDANLEYLNNINLDELNEMF